MKLLPTLCLLLALIPSRADAISFDPTPLFQTAFDLSIEKLPPQAISWSVKRGVFEGHVKTAEVAFSLLSKPHQIREYRELTLEFTLTGSTVDFLREWAAKAKPFANFIDHEIYKEFHTEGQSSAIPSLASVFSELNTKNLKSDPAALLQDFGDRLQSSRDELIVAIDRKVESFERRFAKLDEEIAAAKDPNRAQIRVEQKEDLEKDKAALENMSSNISQSYNIQSVLRDSPDSPEQKAFEHLAVLYRPNSSDIWDLKFYTDHVVLRSTTYPLALKAEEAKKVNELLSKDTVDTLAIWNLLKPH